MLLNSRQVSHFTHSLILWSRLYDAFERLGTEHYVYITWLNGVTLAHRFNNLHFSGLGLPLDFGLWLWDLCSFNYKSLGKVMHWCWWLAWCTVDAPVYPKSVQWGWDQIFVQYTQALPLQPWQNMSSWSSINVILDLTTPLSSCKVKS